jgi:hypothetical protein
VADPFLHVECASHLTPIQKLIMDYRESLLSTSDLEPARRRKPRGMGPVLWVWLLVPVVLVGLNWSKVTRYYHPVSAALPMYMPASPLPTQQPDPAIDQPQAMPQAAHAPAKPLSGCLAGGTVITEQVLRCRFGEVPRPKADTHPAQGMVSEAYLAQYKAERAARPSAAASRSVYPEWQEINGWDGTGRYRAIWQVSDNQIDYTSVCLNYGRGSIDYRECRKGARQWFKRECQKFSRDGNSQSLERQRYCSAASGFSPMG